MVNELGMPPLRARLTARPPQYFASFIAALGAGDSFFPCVSNSILPSVWVNPADGRCNGSAVGVPDRFEWLLSAWCIALVR